jgi:hypothetical protein
LVKTIQQTIDQFEENVKKQHEILNTDKRLS